MQYLFKCLFITLLCVAVHGNVITNQIQSVSTGLSFGKCHGYCRQAINITSHPLRVLASKEPNFQQDLYPPIQKTFLITSNEWDSLISDVKLNIFQSLADRIGCPDCADGGAEWIDIVWTTGSKRVTFENRQVIQGLEALLQKLRQMRQQYISQI